MTTMKAAFSTAYGAPVQVGELPRPVASADQVLIKVHAASLNPIDVKRNVGALRQLRPQAFPMRQGYDVAGVVEDVGSEVTAFKKGDEVYARVDETDLGTVAEYVAAKAAHTAIKPANVSFVQAAAIPLAALTALQAFKRAGLSKGAKVFIPAGAGGVGHMAIQIAKAYFEAGTVASTASTNKVAFVQSLGADIVVDYKKESYWDKLEHDYDFVLDTTGDLENELKILKVNKDAKVHSIALLPDSDEAARKFNATLGFFVRCFLDFKTWMYQRQAAAVGATFKYIFMDPSGADLATLTQLVEAGKLKPVIDKEFPLEQTAAALKYLEDGHATGKVIVKIL